MADVIIFGQEALSEEKFKGVLKEKLKDSMTWAKGFKQSLGLFEKELLKSEKDNHWDYGVIYKRWETILNKYMANAKDYSKVFLSVVTHADGKDLRVAEFVQESKTMEESGIRTHAKELRNQLMNLSKRNKKAQQMQAVQNFLNTHYQNFLKSLDTNMPQNVRDYFVNHMEKHTIKDKNGNIKPNLKTAYGIYSNGDRTDDLYSHLYAKQGNQGKQIEAFMSHVAEYHTQIFAFLSKSNTDIEIPDESSCDFQNVFNSKSEEQIYNWLYGSFNSRPWYTGGDIIVINKAGQIAYNIQVKSNDFNKPNNVKAVLDLSIDKLQTAIKALEDALTVYIEGGTIDRLAERLFAQLKTEAIEVEKTYVKAIDDFSPKDQNIKCNLTQ